MPRTHELPPDDDDGGGERQPKPPARDQRQQQQHEEENENDEVKKEEKEDIVEEDKTEDEETRRKPKAVSSFGRHVQQQQQQQQQQEEQQRDISSSEEMPPPTNFGVAAKYVRPSKAQMPSSLDAPARSSEADTPLLRISSRKGNHELNIPVRVTSISCAATVPGAVSVGDFDERVEFLGETLDDTLHDTYPPRPRPRQSGTIEAHLAPDDAEIEARITERVEDQITKKVEERLLHDIIVATEVKEDTTSSAYCCGLKRYTFAALVVLIAIVVGGVVGGVLSALSNKKKKDDAKAAVNPTAAPIMDIDDPLVDELREWIVPTEVDLIPFSDPSSAQSRALEWLRSDPITMSSDRSTQIVLERYILAVLYFSTSGPNWLRPHLSEEDVCNWNSGWNGTSGYGVFCFDHNQTVDHLFLDYNNLRGTLPWELFLLTNLMEINVDGNSISGTIPSRIGELSELEVFWAFDNELTGAIPSTFGPSMLSLDLKQNAMTGPIPRDWDKLMPQLQYVMLGLNFFTGTIPPELGAIEPLTGFEVQANSFTGSVEQFFCGGFQWDELWADCDEVECSCCTYCCYDGDAKCYPQ